jgi:hypothetical protein
MHTRRREAGIPQGIPAQQVRNPTNSTNCLCRACQLTVPPHCAKRCHRTFRLPGPENVYTWVCQCYHLKFANATTSKCECAKCCHLRALLLPQCATSSCECGHHLVLVLEFSKPFDMQFTLKHFGRAGTGASAGGRSEF